MPCAISINRPIIPSNFSCQFDYPEHELIEFADKRWCEFHLPIEDLCGVYSKKSLWKEDEINSYKDKISAFCNKEKKNSLSIIVDLRYIVVPPMILKELVSYKNIDFSYAIFYGGNFDNSDCRKIKFHQTTFNTVSFVRTEFKTDPDFSFARFNGYANFENAIFFKNINFEHSVFADEVNFRDAFFGGSLIFSNSIFSKNGVSFSTVKPTKFYEISNEKFNDTVDFTNTIFNGNSSFTNRIFMNKTDFTNCTFHIAPDFHGCQLHQNTIFPEQRFFKDTQSLGASGAYRTLTLAMANYKARREEAMFYALEQKSLRPKRNITERALSYIYDVVSAYGQSIGRVMWWILGLTLFFCFIYTLIFTPFIELNSSIDWKIVEKSFGFAIQQIIRPFNIWSPSNHYSLWLKLLTMVQTLFSLILLTLLIFTVRWRFKRE